MYVHVQVCICAYTREIYAQYDLQVCIALYVPFLLVVSACASMCAYVYVHISSPFGLCYISPHQIFLT